MACGMVLECKKKKRKLKTHLSRFPTPRRAVDGNSYITPPVIHLQLERATPKLEPYPNHLNAKLSKWKESVFDRFLVPYLPKIFYENLANWRAKRSKLYINAFYRIRWSNDVFTLDRQLFNVAIRCRIGPGLHPDGATKPACKTRLRRNGSWDIGTANGTRLFHDQRCPGACFIHHLKQYVKELLWKWHCLNLTVWVHILWKMQLITFSWHPLSQSSCCSINFAALSSSFSYNWVDWTSTFCWPAARETIELCFVCINMIFLISCIIL